MAALPSDSSEIVLVDSDQGVVTVTLNRPKALNALDEAMLLALEKVVAKLHTSADVRVVILTGAGEKAFVAGADIKAMSELTPVQAHDFSALGHRVFTAIESLPMPVITAVNGFALGGGLELAMSSDLIYASSNAKFGQPEVNLGLIPGFGGTVRLPRLIGRQAAAELILSGGVIGAERARELGLVLAVYAPEALLGEVKALAKKIASRGPLAVASAKQLVKHSADVSSQAASELEKSAFAKLFTSADQREGCAAFSEKRPAQFVGR